MPIKLLVLSMLCFLGGYNSFGQVSISQPASAADASSMLDVKSTNRGFLLPRMTAVQRTPGIINPATGLLVYQTDGGSGFYYNAGTPGAPNWVKLNNSLTGWSTTGNSGTDTAINFLGTTDNNDLRFRVNNVKTGSISLGSIFMGAYSGTVNNNIYGYGNAGYGPNALMSNENGHDNTAVGSAALLSNVNGSENAAVGSYALYKNTGNGNTATGHWCLYNNTTGYLNTAAGYQSMWRNETGNSNIAIGTWALYNNMTGYSNIAIGVDALARGYFQSNTVAVGDSALLANGTGAALGSPAASKNTAIGSKALRFNGTGSNNTAAGFNALFTNTTGSDNTAVGNKSLFVNNGIDNSALGDSSLYSNTTGSENTAIGSNALSVNTAGSRNTAFGNDANVGSTNLINASAIGANAMVNANNAMVLGSIKGINGATADVNVGIGTITPSARLHVYHNENIDKNAIYGYASQSSGSSDYHNVGVAGFGEGNGVGGGSGYGFGYGVKGIGSQNSYGAIGVYAAIAGIIPNPTPGGNFYGLYADVLTPASNRYAATFMNGNVGIGTTVPFTTLHVKGTVNVFNGGTSTHSGSFWAGTSNVDGMEIVTTAGGDAYIGIQRAAGAGLNISRGSGTGTLVAFSVGGVTVGSISTTGATTSFNTTSDLRLKENIEPAKEGLATLLDIHVKDYSYSFDPNKEPQTGFLAQELYKIFPQAVTPGGEDAKTNPWTIDYSKLTPLIVKGIQDQQAEIERLQVKNNEMDAKTIRLEKQLAEASEIIKKLDAMNERLKKLEAADR